MDRYFSLPWLAFLVALGFPVGLRAANEQNEGSDAGERLTTARDIVNNMDQVAGNIHFAGDCDIYCFYLPTGATVTIQMESLPVDCTLLLFDGLGHGLAGDDDGWAGGANTSDWDSEISITLPAGIYYVSCSGNSTYAYDNQADYQNDAGGGFLTEDDGNLGSPTTERLYGVASSAIDTGAYTLYFDFFTGPPGVRADARSGKRKSPGSHKGNGKYNNSGVGQKATIQKPYKRKIKCYFSCENDSTYGGPAVLTPKGLPKSKFRYKAFDVTGGKKNITADVKKGYYFGFETGTLKNLCFEVKNKKRRPVVAKVKLDCRSGVYRDVARCDLKFRS